MIKNCLNSKNKIVSQVKHVSALTKYIFQDPDMMVRDCYIKQPYIEKNIEIFRFSGFRKIVNSLKFA